MRRGLPLLLLAAGGLAQPAFAQSAALRVGVGQVRADQVVAVGDTLSRSGLALSLDGAFGVGPVSLAVRYLEGSLASNASATDTDVVDGEVVLWIAPVRWAALGAGHHIRAFVAPAGTERWSMWEVRARGSAQLTGALGAYGVVWTVLGSGLPVPGSLDTGLGLEGGLRLVAGRLPFSVELRYRVERLTVADAGRRETIEQLGIAIGVGRR